MDPFPPLSIGYLSVAPGISLRYGQAQSPVEPTLGTILLIQGRGEFIEIYYETAQNFLTLGYHVVTFDWRGQGLSSRLLKNRQKGYIDSYDTYISDLHFIILSLIHKSENHFVLAVAHSMGGHILARYLDREPNCIFDGIILSAPMIDIAKNRFSRYGLWSLSFLMVELGFGQSYAVGMKNYGDADRDFAKNRRTHDPVRFQREVTAIINCPDLALGGITWSWLYATMVSILKLRQSVRKHQSTKILIISAGDEKIVRNQAQKDYAIKNRCSHIYIIENSYHEIMQETNEIRSQFWAHALNFIKTLPISMIKK